MALSHDQIRDKVRAAIGGGGTMMDGPWIQEVWDDHVVYELEGSHYSQGYALQEDQVVLIGERQKVEVQRVYVPAAFAMDEVEPDGDTVVRRGKLFEVGDYPDKSFSLTEEEADQALADFRPVPNDLEHRNTVLDGHLGVLEAVERRGAELFGSVRIPKWLDAVIGDKPVKASLAWDRNSKRIVGNALVLNPRIEDAALMAAFSARLDDSVQGSQPMKLKDRIKALFGAVEAELQREEEGSQAPADATTPESEGSTSFSQDQAAELEALRARAAELEAERDAERARRVEAGAASFVADAVQKGKITPAEVDAWKSMYTAAAQADGEATFSEGGPSGPMLQNVLALMEARPASRMTTEVIAGVTVFSGEAPIVTPESPALDVRGIYDSRRQAEKD